MKKNTKISNGPINTIEFTTIFGIANSFRDTHPNDAFDGGKTFPYNGPTNIQPPNGQGLGDALGVQADKFGNIWYGTTYLADSTGNFIVSSLTL